MSCSGEGCCICVVVVVCILGDFCVVVVSTVVAERDVILAGDFIRCCQVRCVRIDAIDANLHC